MMNLVLEEMHQKPIAALGLDAGVAVDPHKLFEALLKLLEAESLRRPVLMIFEDAHWIDVHRVCYTSEDTTRSGDSSAIGMLKKLPMSVAKSKKIAMA
jgi:hypothetical protein